MKKNQNPITLTTLPFSAQVSISSLYLYLLYWNSDLRVTMFRFITTAYLATFDYGRLSLLFDR